METEIVIVFVFVFAFVFVVVFLLVRSCFFMTPISFARVQFGLEGRKALNPTQWQNSEWVLGQLKTSISCLDTKWKGARWHKRESMLGEDCFICCTFDNGVNIETVSCKKQMKLWSDWKRLTSESFHVCWNFLKCFWSLKCIYAQWIHHMVKDNVLKKCCHKFQKKTCFSLTLFQFNILLLHCGTFISVINFQSSRKYFWNHQPNGISM